MLFAGNIQLSNVTSWLVQNAGITDPRWRRPPSWKINKRVYLGQLSTNVHQIYYADRYRSNVSVAEVQNNIFWKFKMAAAAVLENTQKDVFRSIIDQFALNLVCWWIQEVQNSTFGGGCHLEKKNKKGIFWPVFDNFAPHLVCWWTLTMPVW